MQWILCPGLRSLEIEKVLDRYKPDTIYTHHRHDLNIDHQITFSAVLTAARPLKAVRYVIFCLLRFPVVLSGNHLVLAASNLCLITLLIFPSSSIRSCWL